MLAKLLPLLSPLLVPALSSGLAALTAWGISLLQKNARLANLAAIAQACDDALTAALKASGGQATPAALQAALAAAKAQVLADLPDVEKGLEAELDVLIHGNVLSAVTANGQTVNMPSLVPAK
jgi:hypothetical protein